MKRILYFLVGIFTILLMAFVYLPYLAIKTIVLFLVGTGEDVVGRAKERINSNS